MTLSDGIVLCVLLAGLVFSIGRKKLTVPAALTGALLGWVIYAAGGLWQPPCLPVCSIASAPHIQVICTPAFG